MTRSCDSCTLCCKIAGVRELDKPPHMWCKHCKIGAGCRIYESRPSGCAHFACFWLEGHGGSAERPDRIGCIVYRDEAPELGQFLAIFERRDGTSSRLAYVQEKIRDAMRLKRPIFIEREGAYATLMLPDGFSRSPDLCEYIESARVYVQTYRAKK